MACLWSIWCVMGQFVAYWYFYLYFLSLTAVILPAWRSAVTMTRREKGSLHREMTVFMEHLHRGYPNFKVIKNKAICTKYYGAQHHKC